MNCTTRRSFVIGTGCAGAAAAMSLPRAVLAGAESALIEADADFRHLIDEERKTIRAVMTKESIPGAAICLIYDGKPAWIEGFGVIDERSKRPVGLDTIFSIQSTSKNMTATAIMLAVQRGLLDLDKPITTYLPDFAVHSRFEVKPQEKMTLRHLLAHRAGFTHHTPIGNDDDLSFPSFEAHVRSISDTWLRFPVGDRFRYSNLGVDLAGFILQTVMRKPFADCLKTLLLDPLEMGDTTAETDDYMQRANRALGLVEGYETVPRALPFVPAGGIYASPRDLATYLLFHLSKGKSGERALLDEPLWNEMHSFPFSGAYSLGVAGWKLQFGDTDLWTLHHNGGGCGFGCVFRFYPEEKLGLAVLFNRGAGSAYRWGAPLIDQILARRHGPQQPRVRIDDFPAVKLAPATLGKFVGNWIGGESSATEFRIKGENLMTRRGTEDVPVRVVSPSEIAIADEGPNGNALKMTHFPPRDGATAHIESAFSFGHLDYNDGPNDAPGPNKEEWNAFVGKYWIHFWRKPAHEVIVHRQHGYLYLNEIRLVNEFKPGLFFTSDGEAVDFTSDPPRWRSLPLRRA
jgi:CubicO group peptidase (beta-lactamase class C family)